MNQQPGMGQAISTHVDHSRHVMSATTGEIEVDQARLDVEPLQVVAHFDAPPYVTKHEYFLGLCGSGAQCYTLIETHSLYVVAN